MIKSQTTIAVTLDDGSPAGDFTVSRLKLKDYDRVLLLSDNEFELTAAFCGKTKTEIEALSPESYEQLRAAGVEINVAFFAFVARRTLQMADRLNSVNPEVLNRLAEKLSKPSQPGLRPQ